MRGSTKVVIGVVIVLIIFIVFYISSELQSETSVPTPLVTDETPVSTEPVPKEIHLTIHSVEPSRIEVEAGEEVYWHLFSDDGRPLRFIIDGYDINILVTPWNNAQLRWTPDEVGEFEMLSIDGPDYDSAGKGVLVVI